MTDMDEQETLDAIIDIAKETNTRLFHNDAEIRGNPSDAELAAQGFSRIADLLRCQNFDVAPLDNPPTER